MPAEITTDQHDTGETKTPEPHDIGAVTTTPPSEQAREVDAASMTESEPIIAPPALEISPTQTRADAPTAEVASAAPAIAPKATTPDAPVPPPSAIEMSSTQTREEPVPAGPKVEWSEPRTSEAPTPRIAVAQPAPEAQPAETPPSPPLPNRMERPKRVAIAAPVQSRIKTKPMMVGTSGALPKPPATKSVGADAYSSAVRSAIGRNKATAAGRGSATVTFAIGPGGTLRSAQISKSSGNSALDQAALASVRRARPFPKPPAGAKSTYSIQIYFR